MANQPSMKSIFDFIYLDNSKIHSYYAQLTDGLPNQKRISDKNTTGRSSKGTLGPRDIAHGEHSTNSSEEASFEELMDMEHTLPRYLINLLDKHGMIARELSPNHLGKLVLVEGSLHMIDAKKIDGLVVPILNVLRKDTSEEQIIKYLGNFREEDIIDYIKIFNASPKRMQANLMVEGKKFNRFAWLSLQQELFTQPYLDFSLKHNHVSDEKFFILGILDAIPDNHTNETSRKRKQDLMHKVIKSNILGEFSLQMNEAYKAIVGRPDDFYGMTPICIFRKIDIPKL